MGIHLCEICLKPLIDTENGYITECMHYRKHRKSNYTGIPTNELSKFYNKWERK